MRTHLLHLGALSVLLLASGAAITAMNQYHVYVMTLIALFGMLAVSFDVLLGYTGYLSLAHGALFGVGAYAFGLLTSHYHLHPWLALPAAGVVTLLAGALTALLAFRTKGLYFAVLTLGMGMLGFQLFTVATSVTGGLQGLAGIPGLPVPAGWRMQNTVFNALVLVGFLWLAYLACYAFTRSRIGRECVAVREDATLAQALGIGIGAARLAAFCVSAVFAGLAGALYAAVSNYVGPESFSVTTTGLQLIVFVVVGGVGTLWGSLVGAALLTILSESLREAHGLSVLIYGVLLLLFVLFVPRGIAGFLLDARKRLRPAPRPA
jgi:branched-chain amino acid transport system permease protein